MANLEAVRVLRLVHAEMRPARPDEQRVLARWSGWGALPQVFDDRDTRSAQEFTDVRDQLRPLLSDDEWSAARASTLNAHYTDGSIVSACWDLLGRLGFTGGVVLEPGCGAGAFIGLVPNDLARATRFVGVELEPTTAAIAALLYPRAQIRNEGFETSRLKHGSFDAVVGNVPFGKYVLHDPVHNSARHSIHNHFLLKATDLAKPGGLVVALTSTWTMDARNPAARRDLYQKADLVGAIRLPSKAHHASAGTDVVTDLLVLRRRMPGEDPLVFDWERTTVVATDDGEARINQWFTRNPEDVLGRLGLGGAHAATTIAVTPEDGGAWRAHLADRMHHLAEQAHELGRVWVADRPAQNTGVPTPTASAGDLELGSLALPDGVSGPLVELTADGPKPIRTRNRREAVELRTLVQLRDTTRLILTAQGSDDPAQAEIWMEAQDRLGQLYDRYLSQFGRINDARLVPDGVDDDGQPVMRREPRVPSRIQRDPGWPLLAALEVVDTQTEEISKAAIFTERVVIPYRSPSGADTAVEALSICLAERGRPDLAHIADLLGTDEQAALRELGDRVFVDPISGELETAERYLSGDVRTKLDEARSAAEDDPYWQVNVAALEAALPRDLVPSEIDARLGAPWIPVPDVTAFVQELLRDRGARVHHSPLTATWKVVAGTGRGSVAASTEWGTGAADAYTLLRQALNLRPTIVYTEAGDGTRVRDEQATIAAQEKRTAIEDRFATWVWEHPERAERLARRYNQMFNREVLPTWDGSHLTLPGLTATFTPHQHQRDAVWRIVSGGNTLLGHAVGAGKTATMIMAGLEARRLGLVNKPMYVVPNHMLEQFGREFLQLYPGARVLLAGKADLARGARQEFAARCATGNWDAIVITHASFGRLPVSPQTERGFLKEEIDRFRDGITRARVDEMGRGFTVKELEKAVMRFEEKLARVAERERDTGMVSFEDLGIDYLFIDEAHLFKGLPIVTKLPLSAPRSQRALDLCMKVDWLRERYGDRVATFATGTPVANSLAEIWVMSRYLAPETLKKNGVEHFDAWAATFARSVTALELAPEGGRFRLKTRIARFSNVPELLTMFRSRADLRPAAVLDLPVPQVAGATPRTVVVDGSPELSSYINELGARADAIRGKKVEPYEDNMLKVSLDGRLASLDLRLVRDSPVAKAPIDPDEGKLAACADEIASAWRATRRDRYRDAVGREHPTPGALQVVFCDQGTPNDSGRFDAYTELRRLLGERGLAPDRVAFVHDAPTDAAKADLFRRCREGEVSVLVGSTERMGVGTNIQARLVALHHLDAPWRPCDVEQREGRILRQGNQNAEVHILRYVTEGSFDAFMWQTLERKARFIGQVTAGTIAERSIDDFATDQVLSYAEVKALAAGSPLVQEAAEIDTEIAKLRRLRAEHEHEQSALVSGISVGKMRLPGIESEIAKAQRFLKARIETRGDAFFMTFVATGQTIRERTNAGSELLHLLPASGVRNQDQQIATLAGVPVYVSEAYGAWTLWVAVPGNKEHGVVIKRDRTSDTDPVGLVKRLENQAGRLEDILKGLIEDGDQTQADIAHGEALRGRPFPHADRLRQLEKRSAEITAELAKLGEDDHPVQTPTPEESVPTAALPPAPTPPHETAGIGL